MRAGGLDQKLRLLRPEFDVNQYGEGEPSYVDAGTVWAERVKLRGNRSEEAGEHFPDYRAEFNIRCAHTVEENWRAQHLGGHLYEIVAIVPNIRRGMITLVCERVNE